MFLLVIVVPLKAHGEPVVLNLVGLVELVHKGGRGSAHSHDAVCELGSEEPSLRELAAKHKVIQRIPSGKVLVHLIVKIPSDPKLISRLVSVPAAPLGVGLRELATVFVAVPPGIASVARKLLESRRLGRVKVLVGMVTLPTIFAPSARESCVMRTSVDYNCLPLRTLWTFANPNVSIVRPNPLKQRRDLCGSLDRVLNW
mmetsp:Transcript_13508/g.27568  ORF Transcript_13508/g.27568 Transcript_13508/m.27568 type:complete len:200 (-) Transcript_13508:361-960(-)